jgi:hypothetical protein
LSTPPDHGLKMIAPRGTKMAPNDEYTSARRQALIRTHAYGETSAIA